MNADNARNQPAPPFQQSPFVHASVMNVPLAGLVAIDAELKTLAFDSGPPQVVNRPGVV